MHKCIQCTYITWSTPVNKLTIEKHLSDYQKWTFQRHMQHWEHDTERKQTKQNTQHIKLKR